MAKSKVRKNRKPSGGTGLSPAPTQSPGDRRRQNMIMIAAVLVVVAGGAAYWWNSAAEEREFLALAESGKASLSSVKNERCLGGGHLQPGRTRTYPSRFPTSGSHHAIPTDPGFHDRSQQPIHLVHALEHGHIVIYYEKPTAEVIETLRRWSNLYTGQWSGIVVTPMPRLGEKIILTAWTKRLDQPRLDPEAAAAFIDAFRGRGPENPVR